MLRRHSEESFREALEFGKDGEHLIARALMRAGVSVSPLYQFDKHDAAPVMLYESTGSTLRLALPDLTCFGGDGRVFFGEVKRKRRWVRFDNRTETGFNQSLYRQYVAIEDRTGVPIWVFFVHEHVEPTGVFVAPLKRLRKRVRMWNGRIGNSGRRVERPLALFPISEVVKRWELAEIEGLARCA